MTNRLQETRRALEMTQPQVSAKLKEIEPRADVGMVSRYEKGVCLPTDEQLSALEALYGIPRTELYEPKDLDLLKLKVVCAEEAATGARKDTRSVEYYRKCYRISREFEERLPDDLLQVYGYSSWQSWHDAALKRLLGEYAARSRTRKPDSRGRRLEAV